MPRHSSSLRVLSDGSGSSSGSAGDTSLGNMLARGHGHGQGEAGDSVWLWRRLSAREWAVNAKLAADGIVLIVRSGCVASLVAIVKQKAAHALVGQLSACANHLPRDRYEVLRQLGRALFITVDAMK